MSFKNKMKNRGMSKLDSLVETPESVTLTTPKKKTFPRWLQTAIPIAAGVVIATGIVLPITLSLMRGYGSSQQDGGAEWFDPDYGGGEADYGPTPGEGNSSSSGEPEDPIYSLNIEGARYSLVNPQTYSDTLYQRFIRTSLTNLGQNSLGDKVCDMTNSINPRLYSEGNYSIFHVKNSNSNGVLLVTNGIAYYVYSIETTASLPVDSSFSDILTFFGIDAYSFIEAYEGLKNVLTYTFNNEDSTSIVNNLKTINSNFASIEERNKNYERDDTGIPKGVYYEFILSDGLDCLPLYYCSQSCDIVTCSSLFSLKNTDAFTLMDSKIEMDYDPNYSR